MHASKTLIQKIALELSDVANDNSFLLLQITFLRIFRNSHTVFQMCVFSNLIFCKLSYLYCQEVEQGWVGPFFAACPGRGLPKCVASHTSQVFVLFSTVFGLFLRCGSRAGYQKISLPARPDLSSIRSCEYQGSLFRRI